MPSLMPNVQGLYLRVGMEKGELISPSTLVLDTLSNQVSLIVSYNN